MPEKISFSLVCPRQDGWSMHAVSSYWHTVATEVVEHRDGRRRASLPFECREMLRRIQHSPGQRVRRTYPGCSSWTEPRRTFFSESFILKSK